MKITRKQGRLIHNPFPVQMLTKYDQQSRPKIGILPVGLADAAHVFDARYTM